MEAASEQDRPATESEAERQAREGEPGPAGAAPREGPAAGLRGARAAMSSQVEDLVAAVRRLEAFAADEAKRVSGKLLPQVESKAKQNIWVSLLLALGLGLILGIWLTGGRRRE